MTNTSLPILMAVQGTNQFHSEKLIAYKMRYRHQFTSSASIDLAIFFNDYRQLCDFILDTVTPGTGTLPYFILPVLFSNDKSAYSYGIESSIDWRLYEKWHLQGSYSYLNIHTDSNAEFKQLDATFGGANRANPLHQLSLRSHYDFSDRLQMNLWFRYDGFSKVHG